MLDTVSVRDTLSGIVPNDVAAILVNRDPSGDTISVVPRSPQCAPMGFKVMPGGDEVFGTMGMNTPIEVSTAASRYSSAAGLEELALIVQAIVHSGLTERVWIQFGRVVKSRATLILENRTLRIASSTIWRLPFASHEEIREYQPYIARSPEPPR